LSLRLSMPSVLPAATGSSARQPCWAERSEIVETVRTPYGERRSGAGPQGATALLEIFASDETGSWTALLIRPDGRRGLARRRARHNHSLTLSASN
jgi:hypothetical protein